MATLDYGSGSAQEAAAFLAYLNGTTANATAIGNGQIWDSATNTWIQRDWKTAGYWASVRSAAPLATDDGLNFLRIGSPVQAERIVALESSLVDDRASNAHGEILSQ